MSEEQKPPKEFQPIEDHAEAEKLLKEGAKAFSSAMVWTKNQEFVIRTHLTLYNEEEGAIYTWIPKDFDLKKFIRGIETAQSKDCFFSVSLPWANIFFKTMYAGFDPGGLKFFKPNQIYKVQRRKDIRFKIPDGQTMKVEFDDPTLPDKRLTKEVIDISAGGIAFHVPPQEAPNYVFGMILKQVTLTIKNRKITTEAEVRHVQEIKSTRKPGVKIGILFKNIRPGDSQHIASYVFEESRKYFLRFV